MNGPGLAQGPPPRRVGPGGLSVARINGAVVRIADWAGALSAAVVTLTLLAGCVWVTDTPPAAARSVSDASAAPSSR